MRVLLSGLALVAVTACGNVEALEPASPSRPIRLAVSLEMEPALGDLAACLPEGTELRPLSDQAALESLLLGYSDAALIWGPRPELPEGYWAEPVASDGLALVVHPRNQVGPLDLDQVAQLLSGQVTDWAAFGQSVGRVEIITREPGSGARAAAEALALAEGRWPSSAAIAGSNGAVLDYVAVEPGAIGYVAASSLAEGVRALTIEGERPEPQKVRDGLYPLMTGVWLVYGGEGSGAVLLDGFFPDVCTEALSRHYAGYEFAEQ